MTMTLRTIYLNNIISSAVNIIWQCAKRTKEPGSRFANTPDRWTSLRGAAGAQSGFCRRPPPPPEQKNAAPGRKMMTVIII